MAKKPIPYRDKFDKLSGLLLAAYGTFHVWKSLQNPEYNPVYHKNNEFWSYVMPALEEQWLMALARIFEDSSYTKNGSVLSVHSLIPEHPDQQRATQAKDLLKKNAATFEGIARLRDHQLGHNNTQHLIDPSVVLTKFPIKYGGAEEIFERTAELLSLLNPDTGHGYVLDNLKDGAVRDSKALVEHLGDFFKMREKHMRKWVEGTIADQTFPPPEWI